MRKPIRSGLRWGCALFAGHAVVVCILLALSHAFWSSWGWQVDHVQRVIDAPVHSLVRRVRFWLWPLIDGLLAATGDKLSLPALGLGLDAALYSLFGGLVYLLLGFMFGAGLALLRRHRGSDSLVGR